MKKVVKKNIRVKSGSLKNSNHPEQNNKNELRFPNLSVEKQKALEFFANGESPQKFLEKLGLHYTIFSTWKKDDPLFFQYYTKVIAELNERHIANSHKIRLGMLGLLLAFVNRDWSKASASGKNKVMEAALEYLVATGNLVQPTDVRTSDKKRKV